MRLLITGGGGFLGSQLCQKILDRVSLTGASGQPEVVEEIVLLDTAFVRPVTDPRRVRQVVADLSEPSAVFAAAAGVTSIFHLASMVSGECEERFDDVVLACHSDQSLALLTDASAQEKHWLGALRYHPNRTVLHTDTSLMPRRPLAWAAWNYERAAQLQQE